jgi:hypothetical protein
MLEAVIFRSAPAIRGFVFVLPEVAYRAHFASFERSPQSQHFFFAAGAKYL